MRRVQVAKLLAFSAAVVMLLVALLGGYVASNVPEPLDEERIGVPRVGDRVVYEERSDGERTRFPFLEFEWQAPEEGLDQFGNPTRFDMKLVRREDGATYRYAYRPGELFPHIGRSVSATGSSDGSTGAEETEVIERHEFDVWTAYHPDHQCLMRAGWQGLTFQEVRERRLADLCSAYLGEGTFMKSTGRDRVRGHETERFSVYNGTLGFWTVWLAPGIPYPVALARCVPTFAGGCNAATVERSGLVLVGFEPGSGEEIRVDPPRARPRDAVRSEWFAPPVRTGLAPGGWQHADPEEALSLIEGDASLTTFQEWRVKHPEARVMRGHYDWWIDEGSITGQRTGRWVFTLAGRDNSSIDVGVVRTEGCPALPIPTVPGTGGLLVCRLETSEHAVQRECACFTEWEFPELLTLDGVAAIYTDRAIGDPAGPGGLSYTMEARSRDRWGQPIASVSSSQAGPSSWMILTAGDGKLREVYAPPSGDAEGFSSPPPSGVAAAPQEVRHGGVHLDGPLRALQDVPSIWYWALGGVAGLVLVVPSLAPHLTSVAVAGFTRLTRRESLAHPRRAQILSLVRSEPGISMGRLRDATGLGSGAVRHHLGVLTRLGEIVRVDAGGYSRYFVAGSMDRRGFAAEAVRLSGGAEARILDILSREPGIHAAEVARRLGVSRPAVHLAVARLRERGLLRIEPEGRRTRLFLAEASGRA